LASWRNNKERFPYLVGSGKSLMSEVYEKCFGYFSVCSKCDTIVSSFLKQRGRQSEMLNDYFLEAGLKKVENGGVKVKLFLYRP
jgi:hypothetical protein